MVKANDVAAYILHRRGPMTAMKLQKLVYYSQAWHLVWEERPLFDEPIQAWANGPVVPELYARHRGKFRLNAEDALGGDRTVLDEAERGSVEAVLDAYADRSAHWLSELTHREAPWREARSRARLGDGERGSAVIEHAAMHEYYDGLTGADADAEDV
ncbi:type II toxin-antitoxin system antitoxin SocA domain-containing protein [Saccharopolyspora sp. NPDC047091]|uniref:Panacea domain-containing protein n=1 Tax=Saccharopolyspora sp. NPDC047091 TaxID=3155924 RepID=UPI0033D5A0F9